VEVVSRVHGEQSVSPTNMVPNINQRGGSAGSDLDRLTAGRLQTSHGISQTLLLHRLGHARNHVHTHTYTRTHAHTHTRIHTHAETNAKTRKTHVDTSIRNIRQEYM